jgi:hypothetical protein
VAAQPDRQQVDAYLAAMAAYQAQTVQLRGRVSDYVTQLWQSLGSWREKDMRRFVSQVTPVVLGGQQAMVSLTSANLAQQRQIALGVAGKPVGVDARAVTGSAARGGVSPAEVYERPFHLVWRQLHDLPRESGSVEKAINAGQDRAVELALDDLQISKQQTARKIVSGDRQAVGYRRVLEGTYSCGLCIVAATRFYRKQELLPIHGQCDCSVNPIYPGADPGSTLAAHVRTDDGQVIPIGDIADVHDRIEQRFGGSSSRAGAVGRGDDRITSYRDALITHEHGELGPVLAVRGASHKSLAQLQRDTAAANAN